MYDFSIGANVGLVCSASYQRSADGLACQGSRATEADTTAHIGIGVAVGVVVLLAILVTIYVLCRHKSKKRKTFDFAQFAPAIPQSGGTPRTQKSDTIYDPYSPTSGDVTHAHAESYM
jgi:hypothetical protein